MVFYGGGQTSSSASKKIAAILRAANHFDRLQLPKPYADLAGEPVWDVSEEQVAKSFRKLSLCCHPDKSSDPEAPAAFELLKKAKACLLNELQQGRSAPSAVPQLGLLRLPGLLRFPRARLAASGRSGTRRPRGRATGHRAMTSDGRSSPPPKPPISPPLTSPPPTTASAHAGARQGRLRARVRQERGDAVGGELGAGGRGAEQQAAR